MYFTTIAPAVKYDLITLRKSQIFAIFITLFKHVSEFFLFLSISYNNILLTKTIKNKINYSIQLFMVELF